MANRTGAGVQANLRLQQNVRERMQEFADKYGISVADLIRLWVGQRLVEEEHRQQYQQDLMEQELAAKVKPEPAQPRPTRG